MRVVYCCRDCSDGVGGAVEHIKEPCSDQGGWGGQAAGGLIRHILKQLEAIGLVEKGIKGGRRITQQGQRDLDLIAARMERKVSITATFIEDSVVSGGVAAAAAPAAAADDDGW